MLVGDALQLLAFYILAHDPQMLNDPAQRLQMVETLALASGSRGMAGGQAIDLAAAGCEITLAELVDMHIHKTGALIRASVRLGALSQPDSDETMRQPRGHIKRAHIWLSRISGSTASDKFGMS